MHAFSNALRAFPLLAKVEVCIHPFQRVRDREEEKLDEKALRWLQNAASIRDLKINILLPGILAQNVQWNLIRSFHLDSFSRISVNLFFAIFPQMRSLRVLTVVAHSFLNDDDTVPAILSELQTITLWGRPNLISKILNSITAPNLRKLWFDLNDQTSMALAGLNRRSGLTSLCLSVRILPSWKPLDNELSDLSSVEELVIQKMSYITGVRAMLGAITLTSTSQAQIPAPLPRLVKLRILTEPDDMTTLIRFLESRSMYNPDCVPAPLSVECAFSIPEAYSARLKACRMAGIQLRTL